MKLEAAQSHFRRPCELRGRGPRKWSHMSEERSNDILISPLFALSSSYTAATAAGAMDYTCLH